MPCFMIAKTFQPFLTFVELEKYKIDVYLAKRTRLYMICTTFVMCYALDKGACLGRKGA